MAFTNITPPESVRGIRELTKREKELFNKKILVPCMRVRCRFVGEVLEQSAVKSCTIARCSNKLKPTVDLPGTSTDKYVLFDPEKMTDEKKQFIIDAVRKVVGVAPQFHRYSCNIGYVDWPAKKCINAVLPEGLIFSGFTQAGHIVHLNLREELLPYKYVIGNILRDKISQCRTVVNKLDLIASEFRTFELDHLAGDADYVTTVNVDRMIYKIDFSKTFWNTRLSSEHRRIWMQFDKNSMVFDCCAGVGPFVLPAARIRIRGVYANDLNPDCVRFLRENMEVNKLADVPNFSVYNMDAINFIKEVISVTLLSEADYYDRLQGGGGQATVRHTENHEEALGIGSRPLLEEANDGKHLSDHCVRAECAQSHSTSESENVQQVVHAAAETQKRSWKDSTSKGSAALTSKVHILMNLPAKSLSFLSYFRGFLKNRQAAISDRKGLPFPVVVHCHCFVKAEEDAPAKWYSTEGKALVKSNLGFQNVKILDVHFVRKVAGRKWMLCVSFELPNEVMFMDVANRDAAGRSPIEDPHDTPESHASVSVGSPNTSGSSTSMGSCEACNAQSSTVLPHQLGSCAPSTIAELEEGRVVQSTATNWLPRGGNSSLLDSSLKRQLCGDRSAFLCEEELLENEPKAKKDKAQ